MDHCILDLGIDGGEWRASRFCRFTPREGAPVTHWIGRDRVGPIVDVDAVDRKEILHYRESNQDRPGRSQSS
jgi:hypothetical protein